MFFKSIFMGLTALVIVSTAFIPNPRAAEIRVPADQSTIQSAIDSAVDGDVSLWQQAPIKSILPSREKPLR